MNRRNFLARSGMIAPAVLLMPDLVVAEIQQDDADIIMVQGAGNRKPVTEQFRQTGKKIRELKAGQITGIRWNGNRFLLTTRDSRTVSVKKLVLNTTYMIDRERGVVLIPAMPKPLEVAFNIKEDKRLMPDLWTADAKNFQQANVSSFMKKESAGFMCVKA